MWLHNLLSRTRRCRVTLACAQRAPVVSFSLPMAHPLVSTAGLVSGQVIWMDSLIVSRAQQQRQRHSPRRRQRVSRRRARRASRRLARRATRHRVRHPCVFQVKSKVLTRACRAINALWVVSLRKFVRLNAPRVPPANFRRNLARNRVRVVPLLTFPSGQL